MCVGVEESVHSSEEKTPGTGHSRAGVSEIVNYLTGVLGIWALCKSTTWLVSPAGLSFFSCDAVDWTRGLLQVSHHWATVLVDESFFHWVNIYISIFSSLTAFICIYFEPGAFLVVSLGLGLWLYVPRSEEKWQVLSCWGFFFFSNWKPHPWEFLPHPATEPHDYHLPVVQTSSVVLGLLAVPEPRAFS